MTTPSSRENQNGGDLSGVFSVVLNRHHPHHRWRFFSVSSNRSSLWTKYCLLCTVCGSAATILAGIFLVVAALFRYYTTSIYYFETVPTYIPAILLSICGVSTIAFSCKRNRNIILLRITACWSLVSAALSSVITITTSLIHMNRLQTLRECVYNGKPNPTCTCLAHSLSIDSIGNDFEPVHYVFENTDCDVIHGILYSALRAVFAISVVAVLLSIFLCMLLYQLIGHERKKAYWSRIRRINSDWSEDFIACLSRERSNLPLIMSPSSSLPMSMSGPIAWGPPPPYEPEDELQLRLNSNALNLSASGSVANFVAIPPPTSHKQAHVTFAGLPTNLENIHHHHHNNNPTIPIISAHPFSPTITSVDPTFRNFSTGHPAPPHHSSSGHPSNQSQRLNVHPHHNNHSNNQTHSNGESQNQEPSHQFFQQQQQQMTLPRTFSSSPPGKKSKKICSRSKRMRSDGSIFQNFQNFNTSESDLREPHRTRDFINVDYDNDDKVTVEVEQDLPGSPLLRGGTRGSNRIAKNFRMGRISSLPNSPLLMNVRRICNIRLNDNGRDDDAKKSNSVTKLSHAVSSLQERLQEDRLANESIENLQSLQSNSYHFQNENYVNEEKNFSLAHPTDEIKKLEGGDDDIKD